MSTLYLEKKTDLNCFSRMRGDNIFLIQRYYYPKKTHVQDDAIEHDVSYKNKQNSNKEIENGVSGIVNNCMVNNILSILCAT